MTLQKVGLNHFGNGQNVKNSGAGCLKKVQFLAKLHPLNILEHFYMAELHIDLKCVKFPRRKN